MKKCPYCAEEIQDEAIKCKFCRSMLTKNVSKTGQEIPQQDNRNWEYKEVPLSGKEKKTRIKIIIWGILLGIIAIWFLPSVFGFLGLIAVVIGLVGLLKGNVELLGIEDKKTAFAVMLGGVFLMLVSVYISTYKEDKKERQKREQIKQYEREHIEEFYQKGLDAVQQQKWNEANSFLDRVKRVDANYKELNKYLEKVRYEILSPEDKNTLAHIDEIYQKGMNAIKHKKRNEAMSCLEKIERVNPNYKDLKAQLNNLRDQLREQEEQKKQKKQKQEERIRKQKEMEPYIIKEPVKGEKVVLDTKTNLMWVWDGQFKGQVVFSNDYYDLNTLCESIVYAGYKGWRVPTIDELKTLIKGDEKPTINNKAFNCMDDRYWSSTFSDPPSSPLYGDDILVVNFSDGQIKHSYKKFGNYLRPVRGGRRR